MSDKIKVIPVNNGGGCFRLIIVVISICFFCSWCIKSCETGSPWAGAVKVAKEYKILADSIWNE